MTSPRLISGPDAAAYCGISPATFAKWVHDGIMPRPVEFTRRWDRKAIDLALDKASGIVAPSTVIDHAEDDAWVRKYEARKAASGAGNRVQAAR